VTITDPGYWGRPPDYDKSGSVTEGRVIELIEWLAAQGQITDPELLAIAGLQSTADGLPYFTGSGTAALTLLTPFSRTLLDDPDLASWQADLGITGGSSGTPGSVWTSAPGAPTSQTGRPGDQYLDTTTGDVYQFS
jgi:hypothetical protein